MSEWGLVSLYYDYEHDDKRAGSRHIQGLVSKAYKYADIPIMILHAYNGTKYLWDRINSDYCMDFDLSTHIEDKRNEVILPGFWYQLSTAFDVFFEDECILPGADNISYVLDNWDAQRDYYASQKNLENDLFNCEGSYGWIFIKCTGNQKDGYKLRYAYNYDDKAESMKSVLDGKYMPRLEADKSDPQDDDILERVKKAAEFFDENGSVMASTEEFWGFEREAAEYLRKSLE